MTIAPFSPSIRLADGRDIPQLGLGVYKVADDDAARLVEGAIGLGYRHVDTATLYANEAGVGAGVRASGVPREELFVTTKVWNDDQGFDETLRAFDRSLELLGMDYVDLYLIHWPAPTQDRYVDTWRALETLKRDGRARSIGVSNFEESHLDRLRDSATETPVINQVELHPLLPQTALRTANASRGIVTESWSPLGRGRLLTDPTLTTIAERHDRSVAQVVLRWHVQQGLVVIPKSNSLERIAENSRVFDFELDATDLDEIAMLESGERTGSHPDALG
jgi:2,5-diketo-D-gluconate reductase A